MLGHTGVDYLGLILSSCWSFIANKRNPEPLPSGCVCPIQANSATHHLCEVLLVVLGLFFAYGDITIMTSVTSGSGFPSWKHTIK